MMNILKLFKVHILTYLYFLLCFLTGYIHEAIVIFLIVIIHELGHVFVTILYKYKIISLEILPFGGITKSQRRINIPINNEILLYLSGVFNQIIFMIVIYCLNIKTNNMFYYFNLLIIIFNLLPIYPLDGFFVTKCLIEKYTSFFNSLKIMIYISGLSLILFLVICFIYNNNQIIIISFLLYENYLYIKKHNLYYYKFLLERHLDTFYYKKIVYENKLDLTKLKRDCMHYFVLNNKVYNEKEILAKKFDINGSF